MAASIPQALALAVAGVPFFGVDACGFARNTDAQLCARWMGLAAFFPFYRNHNALGAIGQEPYVWASVADATRAAMNIRYALLPYWYTLLAQAHRDGDTVMRALAWEFPNEPWLAGVDTQFLVGPAVMVIPVLEPGVETVQGVFPGAREGQVWYDWYTQTAVAGGDNVTIPAPVGHIPVYVRGGHVLPTQGVGMTIAEGRGKPWGVVVGLDRGGRARGGVYLDDGRSLAVGEDGERWVEVCGPPLFKPNVMDANAGAVSGPRQDAVHANDGELHGYESAGERHGHGGRGGAGEGQVEWNGVG